MTSFESIKAIWRHYSQAMLILIAVLTGIPAWALEADAGQDQVVDLPATETLLSGGASSDAYIMSYAWEKLAGPTAVIESPTLAQTRISGLSKGLYAFQLSVTDANSVEMTDIVLVSVVDPAKPKTFTWGYESGLLPEKAVAGERIISVVGEWHHLALSADGRIWSWGWQNHHGQLGVGT